MIAKLIPYKKNMFLQQQITSALGFRRRAEGDVNYSNLERPTGKK